MTILERIQGLLDRIGSYPVAAMVVEFVLIWIVVFGVVRFVQGTRAAGALKGLLILMLLAAIGSRVLGGADAFQRLGVLYEKFLAFVAIALIVIFQPELRRALVRLGETPFFRSTPREIVQIVDEIAEAAAYLSKAKFGALIVMQRQTGLTGLIEGGTVMNAHLSARLLQTIFFPGGALHDLAVVVRGRTITAAGVQLPLAEPADMPDPSLGSRHRAAVGLSKECDALVLVVSEETGAIRIAERGRLSDPMSPAELRRDLERRLTRSAPRSRNESASAGNAPAADTPEPSPDRALSGTGINEATNAGMDAIGIDDPDRVEGRRAG